MMVQSKLSCMCKITQIYVNKAVPNGSKTFQWMLLMGKVSKSARFNRCSNLSGLIEQQLQGRPSLTVAQKRQNSFSNVLQSEKTQTIVG